MNKSVNQKIWYKIFDVKVINTQKNYFISFSMYTPGFSNMEDRHVVMSMANKQSSF